VLIKESAEETAGEIFAPTGELFFREAFYEDRLEWAKPPFTSSISNVLLRG